MGGWRAFRLGLRTALRYPQGWLLLYLSTLFAALLLAALPAALLLSGLAKRPAIREAADGLDPWLVIEASMSSLADVALETPEPQTAGATGGAILLALIVLAALPLLAWLLSAFLEGGLLVTYARAAGGETKPFTWRSFLAGGWHWWGAFGLLAAAQGLAVLVLLVPLLFGAGFGYLAAGSGPAWAGLVILGLGVALTLAVLELTRVLAVRDNSRNLFRAFGQAVRFLFRQPLPVAGLYAFSLAVLGLLHAVYRLGLLPALPLDRWLLVLIAQQSFIVLRVGVRLARLAGATALARHEAQRQHA